MESYRPDLSSLSPVSSAPFSFTSLFPPRASNLQSSTSSTSTLRAARTGRKSTLFTPRPWSRLATTETFSRTAATSTDSSMLHTPSSLSHPPIFGTPQGGSNASEESIANQINRAISSYANRNHIAGHLPNMDYVVEHYRQQHLKEEERKATKLAQKQE